MLETQRLPGLEIPLGPPAKGNINSSRRFVWFSEGFVRGEGRVMNTLPGEGDARLLFEGKGLSFTAPRRILRATRPEVITATLAQVEAAVNEGAWAVGYLAYEAAPAFDAALVVSSKPAPMPLLWFALYDHPEPFELEAPAGSAFEVGAWTPRLSEPEYFEAIARIRAHLSAGDSYQVNYTFPMRAPFQGDAYAWFRQLCAAQGRGYFAYLDTGRFQIVSASPELFFAIDGDALVTRPMKGTRPRGRWCAEDRTLAAQLPGSEKERAENLMIVDLLRNDMGRVSETGSVVAERLFEVERYETVWQMTSTIESRTQASLVELFRGLFPSGSVTGAPKAETMKIIHALEPHPRGVYCGAIGYAAPGRRACFNVAIRTAVVDRETGEAEYHVGGGITWDSSAAPEYAECMNKAAVLTLRRPPFSLLESLRWENGYWLLDEHLARLLDSADYFGFKVNRAALQNALETHAQRLSAGPAKVRLLLDKDGAIHVESVPLPAPKPWRTGWALEPVDSRDVFLYHKTTHRTVYDAARAARPDLDEVLLWNERGEITESTFANVVLEIGGRKLTPPVESGLLGGVCRAHWIATGVIEEAVLRKEDLERATAIHLINSVRQWIAVDWQP